uniref:Uncharacterized protein n=1 Tax=Arundo donax TaxID=35708 RepID=A0A0A9CYC3_ARUDO
MPLLTKPFPPAFNLVMHAAILRGTLPKHCSNTNSTYVQLKVQLSTMVNQLVLQIPSLGVETN